MTMADDQTVLHAAGVCIYLQCIYLSIYLSIYLLYCDTSTIHFSVSCTDTAVRSGSLLVLLTLGFVTDNQFVDTLTNFYAHTPYIPCVLDNGATCHRATRFSGLYVTLPPTRDSIAS
eukprot:COSAG05_NODE_458_length_9621_cov_5.309914_5_plen_117_part_00